MSLEGRVTWQDSCFFLEAGSEEKLLDAALSLQPVGSREEVRSV